MVPINRFDCILSKIGCITREFKIVRAVQVGLGSIKWNYAPSYEQE